MSKHALIHDRIVDGLGPSALEVIDESHMHSGPKRETHFKVVVVADAFEGKTPLQRHRMVNALLEDQVGTPQGVHALSIHAYTPAQWTARGEVIPESPPCRGGSKADAKH
jgi:BolA protein